MKKSKLSITLVTSFIAAMAMSACSSIKPSSEAIIDVKGYGENQEFVIKTDDIYGKNMETSAGISKFYDKVLEVLTRYKFQNDNWSEGEKNYQEIVNWAKNQVEDQKKQAKKNASSNGTSFDKEWKAILKSNNVENSKEYEEKFIYEEEKRVMEEWYRSNNANAEALKNEFIETAMPYHIRHILVKVDEASDAQEKFYKGTVTEDQARKLSEVIEVLAKGKYSFAEVAKKYSEDGSSKEGGDVGIMTNNASSGSLTMVNEFQLGLYAYDFKYDAGNASKANREDVKNGLGFTDEVLAALPSDAVEIPYEAAERLGKYADVVDDGSGNKLCNGSTAVYPRNIVWNKYFNLHNVFLIKNRKCAVPNFNSANANEEFTNLIDNANVADASLTRFNNDGYLVDEKGNVIIGVRSQYGIHFMIIEKSMFDDNLDTYYSTKIPGDAGYDENSYVGYIQSSDTEDYKNRAKKVREAINSFDSTYQYRIFEWLTDTANGGLTVTYTGIAKDKDLGGKINAYIELQRKANKQKQEEGLEKVWKTYNRLIDVQEYYRDMAPFKTTNPINGDTNTWYTRLVSEKIALDFYALKNGEGTAEQRADMYKEFAEGGKYYYYA